MSTRFAVVQYANGQRTVLSIIDGPDAERRAKDYAKQVLPVDKGTVVAEPYLATVKDDAFTRALLSEEGKQKLAMTMMEGIRGHVGPPPVSSEIQEIACRWWSGWTAWCVTRDKVRDLAKTEPALAIEARKDLIRDFTGQHQVVILNGRYVIVPKEKPLTYEQLCQLAEIPVERNPSMVYRRRTIDGVVNHDQGILTRGQSVDSKDLVVNVVVTGDA